MKTKIYKMNTHRVYKNRQLVDGFDMEEEFNNYGKKPKMMIKTYNPITNKKHTFSNRDIKKLFQESSPNSLQENLKQLLKKSRKNKQHIKRQSKYQRKYQRKYKNISRKKYN